MCALYCALQSSYSIQFIVLIFYGQLLSRLKNENMTVCYRPGHIKNILIIHILPKNEFGFVVNLASEGHLLVGKFSFTDGEFRNKGWW